MAVGIGYSCCLCGLVCPDMHSLVVNLYIDPDEYLRYYSGGASSVSAIAVDGRRVSFPANILRPYVTHEGIRGRFLIQFDKQNKFQSISRL